MTSVYTYVDTVFKGIAPSYERLAPRWRTYASGLLAAHKQSMSGMLRELHADIHTSTLSRSLKGLTTYSHFIKRSVWKRVENFLDRRSPFIMAVDDVNVRRFGKKVFAAGYQYDPSTRSVCWSNVLVDVVLIHRGNVLACDFALYLPKQYLQRVIPSLAKGIKFSTKIALATALVTALTHHLEALDIPTKRIYVVGDALYGQGPLVQDLGESDRPYVMRIKSNRRIRLFHCWVQVKEYFSRYKKERYFTDKKSGKRVYYKEAVLEASKLGRCKVFSFQEEGRERPEYYATKPVRLGARTAYRYKGRRWGVEELHRALKQYFGLEACYSGKKETNEAHFSMSYLLFWLFSLYRTELKSLGIKRTLEALWWEYIDEHLRTVPEEVAYAPVCLSHAVLSSP